MQNSHRLARTWPALLGVLLLASPARPATVASVFNGKVPCIAEPNGVQFCAGTLATRVETWDDVPLDANVTIPPAAMDGYVVLSDSARGFHFSCGFAAAQVPDPTLTNPTACTDRGWIRLADARYEARDTQYLAGLLADEGLVIPDKIGVTGASYGGGQSMILAALKDRVMLPDGTFTPWKSPDGLDNMRSAWRPASTRRPAPIPSTTSRAGGRASRRASRTTAIRRCARSSTR